MKIGLDFDGVVSDCGQLKSDCAKMLFGANIPGDRFRRDIVLRNGWLTEEQYSAITEAVYYNKRYIPLLEPVEGAVAYVRRLLADGHEVLVITSRRETELDIAKEWAARKGLGLEFVGVAIRNNKVEAATGLDVYVDDDLHKLEPLVGIVPNLFLFSWEYNLGFDANGVAVRISSWNDLYQEIEALEQSKSAKH